jgi:hypothetical protein
MSLRGDSGGGGGGSDAHPRYLASGVVIERSALGFHALLFSLLKGN